MALVLLVPAIDTFFQFAQPRPGNPDSEILWTIAVPVLLLALVSQLTASYFLTSDHDRSTPEPAEVSSARTDRALDQAIGARVGAVSGAVVGAVVVAVTGLNSVWLVAGLAAAGAAVGYQRSRSIQSGA